MFSPVPKKPVVLLALLPLALYGALAPPVAWPLYRSMLFRPGHKLGSQAPWKLIEKDYGVSRQDVSFRSADGTLIHGWFFRLPGATRTFLVSGGKGGSLYNRSGMVMMLLHCGGSVLVYNYRGYGNSEGTPSLDGVCQDAIGAYDYLVQQEHVEGPSIIAYGESFGSGVTGQLVAHRKVGGVILQSGFSSLLRASRDTLPWLRLYPDSWFPRQMMDNVAVFSQPHPPLLIIHGQKDRVLSCQNARDLYAAATQKKALLINPDGDHGAFGKGNTFFIAVEKFLRENNL